MTKDIINEIIEIFAEPRKFLPISLAMNGLLLVVLLSGRFTNVTYDKGALSVTPAPPTIQKLLSLGKNDTVIMDLRRRSQANEPPFEPKDLKKAQVVSDDLITKGRAGFCSPEEADIQGTYLTLFTLDGQAGVTVQATEPVPCGSSANLIRLNPSDWSKLKIPREIVNGQGVAVEVKAYLHPVIPNTPQTVACTKEGLS